MSFLSLPRFIWITIENVFVTDTKVFIQIIDAAPSRCGWGSGGLDFATSDSISRATSVREQFNWVFLKIMGL